MSSFDDDFDLELITSDDELLDALGRGMTVESADSRGGDLEGLLSDWHRELAGADSGLRRSVTIEAPRTVELGLLGGRRSPRRALAIGALGMSAVLAMTGTAAAFAGAHGPLAGLHRALFGGATGTHAPDLMAVRAQTLLDQVAVRLAAGHRAGGLSDEQRTGIAAMLIEADALLRQDPTAPRTLVRRATGLRTALDELPVLTTPSPADPRPAPSAAATPAPSARATTPPSMTAEHATPGAPSGGTGPAANASPDGMGTARGDGGGDSGHPSTGSDLETPAAAQPGSDAGSGDSTSDGGRQPSSDGSQSSGDTGRGSSNGSPSGSGDSAGQAG